MSKQLHAALSLPVQGAGNSPTGSGTLMDTENELLNEVLGTSTPTSPSSARSTEMTILGSSVTKTVNFDLAKPQENDLNQLEPLERSICGGVQSADIDQHGGVSSCSSRAGTQGARRGRATARGAGTS